MPLRPHVLRHAIIGAAIAAVTGCSCLCDRLDRAACMEGCPTAGACQDRQCATKRCCLSCLTDGCTEASPCCDDGCGVCECCLVRKAREAVRKPEPGPPPYRYRPQLPPKLLPVPTQPTISPARMDAPEPWPGEVETHYDKRITFEPGD